MQGRLGRSCFLLMLGGLLLLPSGILIAESGEGGDPPDWFIPYHHLTEDVRPVLEERASPAALELIRLTHHPPADLIQAGLGQEIFEGDVYPIYHSQGAVYIFRGIGEVTFPDGDTISVALAAGDGVAVVEAWPSHILEATIGKREPPPAEFASSSSERIYSGIQTYSLDNVYFGVRATVDFPQYVDTSSPYSCFNVYTTHVGFSDGEWFESFVGQYKWWGGSADTPTAGFWCSWGFWQFVYKMNCSPGSHKTAEIITHYRDSTTAHMWVHDIDRGDWWSRRVPRADATTRRVTLLQEQITAAPTPTPEASFRPTYIHLGGTTYSHWNQDSGPSHSWADPPLHLSWIRQYHYEFRTWCE